jgi:hypothetical protein
LRYQSFESHPEARPIRPISNRYKEPETVSRLLHRLKNQGGDERIPKMLNGYFEDLYCTLSELSRVLRKGGRASVVIGNVQYSGVAFPVDEITAEIGELVGMNVEKIQIARYRGNSAQQMSSFGRNPARESIINFQKH